MSRETVEWLNTRTLIGFTNKRGNAWHYAAAHQGDEPNHYPEAIPVADVERRLFDFSVVSRPIYIDGASIDDAEGATMPSYVEVEGKQAMVCDDDGSVLGIFSDGYRGHQYRQWLVENVANILDDDLGIGSAGLLKNRAQAWVSVEVPENIETPEGVTFRPNLVAATSFDGSLATTYKRTATLVVCDNTLAAGLSSAGQVFRVKHTRYSNMKVQDARTALAVVHTIGEEFAAEVAALCATDVSQPQWREVLDIMVPLTDAQGQPIKGRSLTMAEHKRGDLLSLYARDARVSPWAGTAFGVLQAFNTYGHHLGTVRGASRVQRNRSNAITGVTARSDQEVLDTLVRVLQAA